ncbi:MAG TPA: helix-turn-helix transcriptional regulator [Oleiagrimonas sp.]|nr:helix-turn-helix transcriptional regulator [Oleiagrimonas sp.]
MTESVPVSDIARLVGDPSRANFLLALGDGRALPAGELAASAGVSASTASAHLAAMTQAGLLTCIRQGRHRYYRIASPQVADMLEAIMVVASASAPPTRSHVDPALQRARTCYKHLAGRLGVAMCDAMRAAGQIELADDTARITATGLALLDTLGLDAGRFRKHPWSRVCLVDWSERREHLAGPLGNAMHKRLLELGWVRAHLDSRAISVTRAGERGFRSTFGIDVALIAAHQPDTAAAGARSGSLTVT